MIGSFTEWTGEIHRGRSKTVVREYFFRKIGVGQRRAIAGAR